MRVSFYGTRGSIAIPGKSTLRYGGNTSCVEIVSNAGTRVVLDAGTGAVALGRKLSTSGKPVRGHLLISHTHWDHIQGIPFFSPLFIPGNEWDIYGPRGLGQSLGQTLSGQMEYTYFPVTMEQMGATIRYHDLLEGTLQLGDIQVTCRYLNHPALTLGYRLEADGATVVYACDHEPYACALATGQGEITGEDLHHAEFLAGADLVIHDAQYRAREYEAKQGWGHSTPEYALALARWGGVQQLALTHHDPAREDTDLDSLVKDLKAEVAGQEGPDIFAAAEGQSLEVLGKSSDAGPLPSRTTAPTMRALANRSVLLALTNQTQQVLLVEAASADHMTVYATVPSEAVTVAAGERPSVILLSAEWEGAPDACRSLRALGAYGAEVAIILVTQDGAPHPQTVLFTDTLIAPFSPAYARTRLRAWLMRVAARWAPGPVPEDEDRRLAATRALGLLDKLPEERFDRITRLASALFGVPIALITLIDSQRQWFISTCGLNARETSRDAAFCTHAIYNGAPLIVMDALADARFADNPFVQGPPRIRFYAGYPLILENGSCVGTLCLIDVRPRNLSDEHLSQLGDLAALTVREFQRGPEDAR